MHPILRIPHQFHFIHQQQTRSPLPLHNNTSQNINTPPARPHLHRPHTPRPHPSPSPTTNPQVPISIILDLLVPHSPHQMPTPNLHHQNTNIYQTLHVRLISYTPQPTLHIHQLQPIVQLSPHHITYRHINTPQTHRLLPPRRTHHHIEQPLHNCHHQTTNRRHNTQPQNLLHQIRPHPTTIMLMQLPQPKPPPTLPPIPT